MAHELKDLAELLDKADGHRPGQGVPEPPTEEEVTRCIQVMLSRQCIYLKKDNDALRELAEEYRAMVPRD